MSQSGNVIDGRAISKKIQAELFDEVDRLKQEKITAKLAVVWLGDDPASGYYFRAKEKLASELGIAFEGCHLAATTTELDFLKIVSGLNQNQSTHGILVEYPLPKQINSSKLQEHLAPQKDIDGITFINQGRLFAGDVSFIPATAFGVMKLLELSQVELVGKHAVVIGRSGVVGKPLAMLLLKANATVTICHSRTKSLKAQTLQADVLCAAAGVPLLIKEDMVKSGAVVIDIGYNVMADGKIVGDVDFESIKAIASLITPVRGGVGAMTATMIMANTIEAAKRQNPQITGRSCL